MVKKVFSGGLWIGIRQFGARGLGLLVFYLITTYVGPEELGLLGMAWLLVAIAESIFGLGMPMAALRSERLSGEVSNTLFWGVQVQGMLMAVALILCAPLLGSAMKSEPLIGIVQILSPLFLFRALSTVPMLYLNRGLELKKVAFLELASVFVGGGVGVWLAMQGYGVWSLVWRHLIAAMVVAVGSFVLVAWRPRFEFSKEAAIVMLRFGVPVCFSLNVAWLVGFQFQQAMVGSVLGVFALGVLSFGRRPFDVVEQISTSVCNSVLMPLLVREKHRLLGERQIVLAVVIMFSFSMLSVAIFLFVGSWIVELFVPEDYTWYDSVILMPILGAATCLGAVGIVARTYLLALGCSKFVSFVAALQAGVAVFLIWVYVSHGVQAVTYAILGTALFGSLPMLVALYYYSGCRGISLGEVRLSRKTN